MEYLVTATILGNLPSLKNQRRIVTNRRTGKTMSIKSQGAMGYSEIFNAQLPISARIGYEGPVSVKVRVHYQSRRSDLSTELLFDLLAKSGIILNDRQIVHTEAWKGLDRDNPRIHFTVSKYEGDAA